MKALLVMGNDKAKPAEREGRKTAGLFKIAGLPFTERQFGFFYRIILALSLNTAVSI